MQECIELQDRVDAAQEECRRMEALYLAGPGDGEGDARGKNTACSGLAAAAAM